MIVYDELAPYIKSYVLLVNNSKVILEILRKYLEYSYYEKHKNNQLLLSLLEILSGLVKDLRAESFDLFLNFIFKELVKYLRDQLNVELIDKIFSVFTNIFKFLNKEIIKNFGDFFNTYAELIFNKNTNTRKFGCESICFILKNLDNYNISMMNTIFDPFNNPQKYFSFDISEQNDVNMVHQQDYSFYNYLKSKHQVKESIISNNDLFYIFDCISDLFVEILIGVNKALSIKADLFICKLTQNLKKEDNKYLLHSIILYSMIKLMKRITNPEKQIQVVLLFYYYIILNKDLEANKTIQYQNKKYSYFNSLFQKENLEEDLLFSLILFNKELLVKFHIKLEKSIFLSLIDQLNVISNSILSTNNNYLLSRYLEMFAILMKLNNNEFSDQIKDDYHYCLNNIIPIVNSTVILKFMSDLKMIQNYKNLKKFSIFYTKREEIAEEGEEEDFFYDKYKEIFIILLSSMKTEGINNKDIMIFFSYLSLLTKNDLILNLDNYPNLYSFLKEILNENLNILSEELSEKQDEKNYFDHIIEISDCFLIIYSFFTLNDQIQDIFSKFIKIFLRLINIHENKTILRSNCLEANQIFDVVFCQIKENNNYYINKIDFYYSLFYKLIKKSYQFIDEENLTLIVSTSLRNINSPFSFKLINFLSEKSDKINSFIIENIDKSKLYFNLLFSDKECRYQTLCYLQRLLKIDENDQFILLTEQFDIMKMLCQLDQDFHNQKSFSFNFEILITKFELISNPSIEILNTFYLFLMGSYWIRLQKGVWPSINKALESFTNLANEAIFDTHFGLMSNLNEIIMSFISVDGYLQKFDKKINEKFFIIKFGSTEEDVKTDDYYKTYVKNITHKLFYKKYTKQFFIETFVEGYIQALMNTYKVIKSPNDLDKFINYSLEILENKIDLKHDEYYQGLERIDEKNKYYMCLIKNIISENYNEQSKVIK